jgi:septum formation protein
MKLILASQSLTRRHMLRSAGVLFEAATALVDERREKEALQGDGLAAHAIAKSLAELKALSLSEKGALVIGCDQTLEYGDGFMLDKPQSERDAFDQLKTLSGRSHFLHSAIAIAENDKIAWRQVDSARLTMRELSDRFIKNYLELEYEQIRHCVGGYQIEGRGAQLFDWIEGSHFAIQGLPLLPLLKYLRERGILLT